MADLNDKLAQEVGAVLAGEVRNIGIDCKGVLDTGELLSGTPSVAEQDSSHLSISSEQVSTEAKTINGRSVPTGEAVLCRVDASGAVKNRSYRLKISCVTTAGQTIAGFVTLKVVG